MVSGVSTVVLSAMMAGFVAIPSRPWSSSVEEGHWERR